MIVGKLYLAFQPFRLDKNEKQENEAKNKIIFQKKPKKRGITTNGTSYIKHLYFCCRFFTFVFLNTFLCLITGGVILLTNFVPSIK